MPARWESPGCEASGGIFQKKISGGGGILAIPPFGHDYNKVRYWLLFIIIHITCSIVENKDNEFVKVGYNRNGSEKWIALILLIQVFIFDMELNVFDVYFGILTARLNKNIINQCNARCLNGTEPTIFNVHYTQVYLKYIISTFSHLIPTGMNVFENQ